MDKREAHLFSMTKIVLTFSYFPFVLGFFFHSFHNDNFYQLRQNGLSLKQIICTNNVFNMNQVLISSEKNSFGFLTD
jgi:hypothetical protein